MATASRRSKTSGKVASESKHFVVTAAIAAAVGLMIVFGPSVLALVVPSMVGTLALLVLVRVLSPGDDEAAYRRLMHWTLAAFAAHLVIGIVVTYAGGPIREYLAAPDAITYHAQAQKLVAHWTEGLPTPVLPAGKEGFYYLLGGVYWLFGAQRLAGLAVNAVLAAAIIPLLADGTRRLFGPAAERYVPPLVLFVPSLLLWPSLLLKEAAVVFCVALAINCAIRITERMTGGALIGMASSLSLLFTLRAWVALVMAAGLIVGVVLAKGGVSGLVSGLIGASAIGIVVALGLGYSGYERAVNDADLTKANSLRSDMATADSGFDADVDISTPGAALSYLVERLPEFVLGPFPWQLRGSRQQVAIPDVVAWWILLPFLWLGYRSARRRRGARIYVLILPALLTTVMLCLSIGNFGTVVRERVQVLVVLVPIAALGFAEWVARRSVAPAATEPVSLSPGPVVSGRSEQGPETSVPIRGIR